MQLTVESASTSPDGSALIIFFRWILIYMLIDPCGALLSRITDM